MKTNAVASALVAEAQLATQPCLYVTVASPGDVRQRSIPAVMDTGAQVCMAGHQIMHDLSICQRDLQDTTVSIKHLAGGRLYVHI